MRVRDAVELAERLTDSMLKTAGSATSANFERDSVTVTKMGRDDMVDIISRALIDEPLIAYELKDSNKAPSRKKSYAESH